MATEVFNDRTYVKENQATAIEERGFTGKAVAATMTINAVGSPGHNDMVILRDFLNNEGQFTFVTSGASGGNVIDISDNPGVDVVYQRLKTRIEAHFEGSILCEIDTSPSGPGGTNVSLVLTLSTPGAVPGTVGQAGDAAFNGGTGAYDNLYNDDPPDGFTGGVDAPPALTEGQFLLGTKSTINIRGQSPTSRYEVFLGEEKT